MARTFILWLMTALALVAAPLPKPIGPRPNILFIIADDWSAAHSGIYGDPVVRTPVLDELARNGLRFTRAFCASPSCTPSRGAILTGQAVHRLREGGNLWSTLPTDLPTFPQRLESSGYKIGHTRKGWSPGRPQGWAHNPAGPRFEHFDAFLGTVPKGQPFSFWFGSVDPHRPYDAALRTQSPIDPAKVRVPGIFLDAPEVRQDLLDYYAEIERLDREVGQLLESLNRRGELQNTLVVITSDNGMPFPRAKANLYDPGTHVPLIVSWPEKITKGFTQSDFINLYDLAPTFLEVAGITPPAEMNGRSILPMILGGYQKNRDAVFLERERHANVREGNLGYPARAIRTDHFLFIQNLRPDRWPAGDPQKWFSVGAFGDVDDGPTKQLLLARKEDPVGRRYYELAFAKRPAEELYDLRNDPDQLNNLAHHPHYQDEKKKLEKRLLEWRKETQDPRLDPLDESFDKYPYLGPNL